MRIIDLKSDDILVLHIDSEKYTYDDICNIHFKIKEELNNKQVIFTFPDGIQIDKESWQDLYDYLMSIKPKDNNKNLYEYIKESKGEDLL